ncbi:hypothetical protein CF15_04570 [Pyrodictium occultum]|uniref:Thioredoxin domain-containing protein n=1 Tax=Pyrodictium occultum TaxID=2309 RepID=A0A0V8RVH4_PYROC|nr:hypothetical protein [Pyrodictium occultum]KSW12057.1 hypothetical protein CF15_04570 [Pyrodictium occultum]
MAEARGPLLCPELEEGVFSYDPEHGWQRVKGQPGLDSAILVFVNVVCRHSCNEVLQKLSEKLGEALGTKLKVYLVVCTRFHKTCLDADARSLFYHHHVIASPAVVLYIGGEPVMRLQGRMRIEEGLDRLVEAAAGPRDV